MSSKDLRRKKILVLNGNMNRGGGTEKMTQVFANCLCKEYDIHVLSLQPCSNPFYELAADVKFRSLKNYNGRFVILNTFFQLFRIVYTLRPTIIINVDVFLSIYSIPLRFLFPSLKVVSWEHFSIENDMGLSWSEKLRSFALRHSDYYVCLTKGDLLAFKKKFKFKTPIDYIYNPFEFQANSACYDSNSKKIVTAGNFFPAKGFDIAIEVAKNVLLKHPDWKWVFYGDGPEKDSLSNLISNYNLQDRILLPGRTTNKDEIFRDSSLYVLTSRTEGFGLVLLEAQSYHLPTIAFDVPYGPREIIINEVNGQLIEPFSVQKMTTAIDELICDEELRLRYSNHATDRFHLFSSHVFQEKWKYILDIL